MRAPQPPQPQHSHATAPHCHPDGDNHTAAAAQPHDAFRTLTDEGRWMLSATRGAAGTHTTGPQSPQGVQRND